MMYCVCVCTVLSYNDTRITGTQQPLTDLFICKVQTKQMKNPNLKAPVKTLSTEPTLGKLTLRPWPIANTKICTVDCCNV